MARRGQRHAGHLTHRRRHRSLPRPLCHAPPNLPLRRNQVRRIRANPGGVDPYQRARNTSATTPLGQSSRRHKRLLHVPSRSDTGATRVRDPRITPLDAAFHMRAALPRTDTLRGAARGLVEFLPRVFADGVGDAAVCWDFVPDA